MLLSFTCCLESSVNLIMLNLNIFFKMISVYELSLKTVSGIGFCNGTFNALLFPINTSLFRKELRQQAWAFCQVPPGVAIIVGPMIAGTRFEPTWRRHFFIIRRRDGSVVEQLSRNREVLVRNRFDGARALNWFGIDPHYRVPLKAVSSWLLTYMHTHAFLATR